MEEQDAKVRRDAVWTENFNTTEKRVAFFTQHVGAEPLKEAMDSFGGSIDGAAVSINLSTNEEGQTVARLVVSKKMPDDDSGFEVLITEPLASAVVVFGKDGEIIESKKSPQ